MQGNIPSRAKSLFDEIRAAPNSVEYLRRLVTAPIPTSEGEFLDFKGGQNLDIGSENLIDIWAKALSCFANSDGGLIIFGIDAPDRQAKSLSPVKDVIKLRERLVTLLPNATEPPVQRVEVVDYPLSPGSSEGFVVCIIPSSPWRPHQIRAGRNSHRIFIRAADNCLPCSLAIQRALFAPQSFPVFEIQYVVGSFQGSSRHLAIQTWLTNTGPATAADVYVSCESQPFPVSIGGLTAWQEVAVDELEHGLRAIAALRPIHPKQKIRMFFINIGEVKFMPAKGYCRFSVSASNQVPMNFILNIYRDGIQIGQAGKAELIDSEA